MKGGSTQKMRRGRPSLTLFENLYKEKTGIKFFELCIIIFFLMIYIIPQDFLPPSIKILDLPLTILIIFFFTFLQFFNP